MNVQYSFKYYQINYTVDELSAIDYRDTFYWRALYVNHLWTVFHNNEILISGTYDAQICNFAIFSYLQ